MHQVFKISLPTDLHNRTLSLALLRSLDIWKADTDKIVLMCTEAEAVELSRYCMVEHVAAVDAISFGALAGGKEAFHDYTTLTHDLAALAASFPNLAILHELGSTEETRKIAALQIAPKPLHANAPRFLFVGCHHACEWISVEVPYLMARRLLLEAEDQNIRPLLDEAEFWFIPMLNADGHAYSTQPSTVIGQERPRLWRKNRRRNQNGSLGVDLNRNYDIDWNGAGSSDIPGHRMYRGTAPFSEPETQCVRTLILSRSFAGAMSYHSYGLEFVYPFGFANPPCDQQCQADLQDLSQLAEAMAKQASNVGNQRYRAIQAINHYEDQVVSGDCADWIFGTTRARTITVELRPGFDSQLGFEIGPESIQPAFEENWQAALTFVRFTLDSHGSRKPLFQRSLQIP